MCSHNSDRSNPAQTFQIQRDSHSDTNWISLPTKTLKENSNIYIYKIEFQVTREPATTGTHLEIVVMDLHDITRREFRQFQTITSWWRNPGAQPKKNIHTRLISKQHSRKTVSWTKGVFSSVNASRNAKELAPWAERKHDNPRRGWKRKLIKSR